MALVPRTEIAEDGAGRTAEMKSLNRARMGMNSPGTHTAVAKPLCLQIENRPGRDLQLRRESLRRGSLLAPDPGWFGGGAPGNEFPLLLPAASLPGFFRGGSAAESQPKIVVEELAPGRRSVPRSEPAHRRSAPP